MLVALYKDHHELPWWGGKTNPFDIFNPEKYKNLPFKGDHILKEVGGEQRIVGNEIIPLEKEKQLFSFLTGLLAVEADDLMAHVSALCDCEMKEHNWWHYPKRVWVQISTLPNEFTEAGIPVVYNMAGDLKPELDHRWGGDNGTSFPSQFFLEKELAEKASSDPKIWTRFFVEELNLDPKLKLHKQNLHAAEELLNEALAEVKNAQIFGKEKLNTRLNVGFNAY